MFESCENIDIFDKFNETVKQLKIDTDLWKTYCAKDEHILEKIYSNQKNEKIKHKFKKSIDQLHTNGITAISGLFSDNFIKQMQSDYAEMLKEKNKHSHHISFDGNNGESWLSRSVSLSLAASNPTIRNIIEGYFEQPVFLGYEKLYTDISMVGYSERAYHPHHDGYGHVGLKAMILLTDVLPDTLGMKYCCGTHDYIYATSRSQETQITFEYWNFLKNIDCIGKAGTVYIFNPNGIHSGWKNIPFACTRSVMVLNFQPGPFRIYGISQLHNFVIDRLSEYEKYVFRSDWKSSLFLGRQFLSKKYKTCEYIRKIQNLRLIMKNKRSIKDNIINDYDVMMIPSLNKNSKHNKHIINTIKIEFISDNFNIHKYLSEKKRFMNFSEHLLKMKIEIKHDINDTIKMFHGDLDLPIRMYCPTSDYMRDNAIIMLRDSKYSENVHKTLHEQLNRFKKNPKIHNLSIDKLINNLNIVIHDDDVDQFVSDLIEMLSRKTNYFYSEYKTILWAIIVITQYTNINVDDYFDNIFFYAIWNSL